MLIKNKNDGYGDDVLMELSCDVSGHPDRANGSQIPGSRRAERSQTLLSPAYYHSSRRKYLIQNARGRWLEKAGGEFRRDLNLAGFGERLDQDRIVKKVEDHFDVDYAGPLAGRMAGFYDENGTRLLVTSSPELIQPIPGEWPTLKAVFKGLVVNAEVEHGQRQWDTLMGWLQTAIRSLRNQHHQDAQALVIAGPPDAGKSLIQHLITTMLGGRAAKGARYMTGKTQFNAELFGVEHIMLEDETLDASEKSRARLASALKSFTVSTRVQSCHEKGKTAINLRPFWRVSITLNNDVDALQVLPPLRDGVEDKLILLQASKFAMPMPTETCEERDAFQRKLHGEIPGFLHWLLNEYKLPVELRDRRFLVKTWHHPTLYQQLEEFSPETELLKFIDAFLPANVVWEGTAQELCELLQQRRLRKGPAIASANAVGTMLGRLAKKYPDRIRSARKANCRAWRIYPRGNAMTP